MVLNRMFFTEYCSWCSRHCSGVGVHISDMYPWSCT